jgi:hypothetical protein
MRANSLARTGVADTHEALSYGATTVVHHIFELSLVDPSELTCIKPYRQRSG